MQQFGVNFEMVAFWLFLLFIVTKNRQYYLALTFTKDHREEVSKAKFENSEQIGKIIKPYLDEQLNDRTGHMVFGEKRLLAPAIMIMNQYALNITHNWLCNVISFTGVHKRLIIFAMDKVTYQSISRNWPQINVVYWPIESLQGKLSTGSGPYQIFQIFRANLASFFAEKNIDFWMIQPDTYWRANLFERADPELLLKNQSQYLLFDKEGDKGLLSHMVGGGNFFVRGNKETADVFERIARNIETFYSTDNNWMTQFCYMQPQSCSFIPYRTLSNWRWFYGDMKSLPSFLQFDGGAGCEDKLRKMQSLGGNFALFLQKEDAEKMSVKCNKRATKNPAFAMEASVLKKLGNSRNMIQKSIFFVHSLCEYVYNLSPSMAAELFLGNLFPLYAYFIVL